MQHSTKEFEKASQIGSLNLYLARQLAIDEYPENLERVCNLLDGFQALDGRMRMLLLRDGTYLAGSSGIDELLESGAPFFLKRGIVRAVAQQYAGRLKTLLDVKVPSVRTCVIPSAAIEGHLIIRATSIWDGVVCVSLQQASQQIIPQLPDLQELFSLTKTEALIVNELFLGCTPQDIAADHHNSVHTVRAHIRRCYDKLGVTCREELWRKLNSY